MKTVLNADQARVENGSVAIAKSPHFSTHNYQIEFRVKTVSGKEIIHLTPHGMQDLIASVEEMKGLM